MEDNRTSDDLEALDRDLAAAIGESCEVETADQIAARLGEPANDDAEPEAASAPSRSSFVTADWSKKVTEGEWRKKSPRRLRRSIVRDQEAIVRTTVIAPATAPALCGPLVGEPHTPLSPSIPPTTPTTETETPSTPPTRRLPTWEFTTDIGKATFANRALANDNVTPYAVSLNLSPDQVKAANDNASGFTTYIKRRVSSRLRHELGRDPLYWFAIDVNEAGRLHLHGGIAANDNELSAIERALCHAGGKWDAGHKQRQCDLRPQTDLDGWARYTLRNHGKVRHLIAGKPVTITNALRARAKAFYEKARKVS